MPTLSLGKYIIDIGSDSMTTFDMNNVTSKALDMDVYAIYLRKSRADLEAEKIKIKGAAEAQARAQLQNIPLEQLFSLLEKSGMTSEQINSFINGYIYANSPNGKVVNIVGNNTNNSNMSETIASVEAAQNSNNNNFVGRRKR